MTKSHYYDKTYWFKSYDCLAMKYKLTHPGWVNWIVTRGYTCTHLVAYKLGNYTYTGTMIIQLVCICTVNRLMQANLQLVMCYNFIICLSKNIFFIKAIKINEICT